MYKTDATFNTNYLKLSLSVIVSINNHSKTFLVAYYYITLECAASFKFVANQLSDLVFYNCLKAAVVVKDFSKGLAAAIATKAAINLSLTEVIKEPLVCLTNQDEEIPKAAKVVVYKGLKHKELQNILLQLCEQHAVAAIKRRLIATGKYTKEHKEELILII